MLKAMAKFSWHLSNLAPLIRPKLFMKIDLQQWLDKPIEEAHSPPRKISYRGFYFENPQNS